MKDMIIIGAGPGGLTAAIYGMRAGLDLLVIEKYSPGGQVVNTYEVENYPGFVDPIPGWELVSAMENQARRLNAEIVSAEVASISKNSTDNSFTVTMADGAIQQSKTVIVASGASYRNLNVPGEKEYLGRGVSYCATCDGAFYKDRVTAVVGGGDTALEEALFLTKFSKKVYLVHRRDQFRGQKILQDRVLGSDKIEPVYSSVVTSINGETGVQSFTAKNVKTEEEKTITVDGVFIFIGFIPNTEFMDTSLLNEQGEVLVNMEMATSIPGMYAIGDVRAHSKRQIVMACADGATAVLNAYEYLQQLYC